jgi:hypothetical protein
MDQYQTDSARKDGFLLPAASRPVGGGWDALRGIQPPRFQRLHPYQPRWTKIHNGDINERFAHGDASSMDSPNTPIVLH